MKQWEKWKDVIPTTQQYLSTSQAVLLDTAGQLKSHVSAAKSNNSVETREMMLSLWRQLHWVSALPINTKIWGFFEGMQALEWLCPWFVLLCILLAVPHHGFASEGISGIFGQMAGIRSNSSTEVGGRCGRIWPPIYRENGRHLLEVQPHQLRYECSQGFGNIDSINQQGKCCHVGAH